MARNRKNQSPGLLVGPALKAGLICMFILICCVGYVWQKKQISELSHKIHDQENRLAQLRDSNDKLRSQYLMLLSPPALDARAKGLGLVPPQPTQIWRLQEPVVQGANAVEPELHANARTPGAMAAVIEQ